TVDATGFRVTVRTHGVAADRLDVAVVRDGKSIGTGNYTGTIDDGATFGVQLPDSLDGTMVTIRVDASNHGDKTGSGMGGAIVRKQQAVPFTVGLVGTMMGDLGVDLAERDTAMPDLAELDAAMLDLMPDVPDLVDLAMPDLAQEDIAMLPPDMVALDGPVD